jgi:hypothetical protein
MALLHRFLRPQHDHQATAATTPPPPPPPSPSPSTSMGTSMGTCRIVSPLPPSVARVAARTRLSAEILAAVLEIEERSRATLDDIERADALADRLITRHRERRRLHATAGGGLPGAGVRISV